MGNRAFGLIRIPARTIAVSGPEGEYDQHCTAQLEIPIEQLIIFKPPQPHGGVSL